MSNQIENDRALFILIEKNISYLIIQLNHCCFLFLIGFGKARIGQPLLRFRPNSCECSKITPFWSARLQNVQPLRMRNVSVEHSRPYLDGMRGFLIDLPTQGHGSVHGIESLTV